MKKLIAPLALVVLAVCIGVAIRGGATASENSEFWYDSDPELTLLKLHFLGGYGGMQSRYSVYADGRLQVERTGKKTLDIPLSPEQVDVLVSTAVEGRLADVTPERQAQLRDLTSKHRIIDSSSVVVSLALPHFKRTPTADDQPISTQVAAGEGSWHAESLKSEPEIACIVALEAALRAYEKEYRLENQS